MTKQQESEQPKLKSVQANSDVHALVVPDKLPKLLKRLEWSSFRRGQGSGPMSSGGDGPMISACPVCRGVDPADPDKNHFATAVHGHRDDCFLAECLSLLPE